MPTQTTNFHKAVLILVVLTIFAKNLTTATYDLGKNPCIQAVGGVELGCPNEVMEAFWSVQTGVLSKQCCAEYLKVDENCWSKAFPYNPFFPPLLKAYCQGKKAHN
ncbi:hypothetical protein AG4045_000131 [Apium graveolens]|uniref:Prolamin-like domain-containing protein n=1 Tax=Apium graveolens TaxID=4045 RepID=A0A6L5BCT4_APIGR|nr:hypothetical protein AG4045_000131 [Apium graveolens]